MWSCYAVLFAESGAAAVDVSLKQLYDTDEALVADLERQLGGRVMSHEVTDVDLGRQHMTVDVRYRPGVGAPRREDRATRIMEPVEPRPVVTPVVQHGGARPVERAHDLVFVGDRGENRPDQMR